MADSDARAEEMPVAPTAVAAATPEQPIAGTDSVALLRDLAQQLVQLQQSFETKIQYDQSKDRQIDMLHADLKVQREGLHYRILQPVIVDLISLYINFRDTLDMMSSDTSEAMLKKLRPYLDNIEEILRRQGVTMFSPELGSPVQREQQRVIKTVDTPEVNRDGTVARVIRPGFKFEETRLLQPAWVESFRASV